MMNEITLSHLFKLALKRLWILLLAAVVLGASAFCYFKLAVSPRYQASGSILVTNGALTSQSDYTGSTINSTDITASLYLTYTVVDILNTTDIFKELSNEMGNKYTYTQLMNACHIERRNEDTLFVDIYFNASSREDAIELVNKFLSLASGHIVKYLPGSNANIATGADKAVQVYPNTNFYAVVAAMLGFVAAYVVVFIIDSLDNTIKGEEYFKNNFDIPLLGSVPDFENSGITSYAQQGGKKDGNK